MTAGPGALIVVGAVIFMRFNRNYVQTINSMRRHKTPMSVLLQAFESGLLKRYNLPNVSLSHKYNLSIRPKMIALNCTNRSANDSLMRSILTVDSQ